MKAKAKIRITHVKEALSQRGEPYYTITGTEDTGIPNPQGGNYSRIWENMYCPKEAVKESPKSLENCEVYINVNFYPVTRTVGDKNYTDIKCNVLGFE